MIVARDRMRQIAKTDAFYLFKAELDQHQANHKQFSCDFCPERFTKKRDMYQHKRQVALVIEAYSMCRISNRWQITVIVFY